ncbi:unnamed protein product [Gongylonema pulchrum]|uniref:RRM domain-containing protein n=1 Tax=Gongylonema pulchrum TaxID=637853 RepID=A0A183E726_9BILA|nr:unnamed protein product [Gongylonema pulchrum]
MSGAHPSMNVILCVVGLVNGGAPGVGMAGRRASYGYQQTEGLSGAEYLASIYGTEKDKVNCSFYFKRRRCASQKYRTVNYVALFEVFTELERKYGEIDEMNVCENIGEHMIGNVYVKFVREEDAEKAVKDLENRWFNGQPIYAELSPVTDFRESRCRQHEVTTCYKGGFCNFMHLKAISPELGDRLFGRRYL